MARIIYEFNGTYYKTIEKRLLALAVAWHFSPVTIKEYQMIYRILFGKKLSLATIAKDRESNLLKSTSGERGKCVEYKVNKRKLLSIIKTNPVDLRYFNIFLKSKDQGVMRQSRRSIHDKQARVYAFSTLCKMVRDEEFDKRITTLSTLSFKQQKSNRSNEVLVSPDASFGFDNKKIYLEYDNGTESQIELASKVLRYEHMLNGPLENLPDIFKETSDKYVVYFIFNSATREKNFLANVSKINYSQFHLKTMFDGENKEKK